MPRKSDKKSPADAGLHISDTGAGGEFHQHAEDGGERLTTAQGVRIADCGLGPMRDAGYHAVDADAPGAGIDGWLADCRKLRFWEREAMLGK